jgi:hypothetical protein
MWDSQEIRHPRVLEYDIYPARHGSGEATVAHNAITAP